MANEENFNSLTDTANFLARLLELSQAYVCKSINNTYMIQRKTACKAIHVTCILPTFPTHCFTLPTLNWLYPLWHWLELSLLNWLCPQIWPSLHWLDLGHIDWPWPYRHDLDWPWPPRGQPGTTAFCIRTYRAVLATFCWPSDDVSLPVPRITASLTVGAILPFHTSQIHLSRARNN